MFTAIYESIFPQLFPGSAEQNALLMALLIGVALGGNLTPAASTHMIKTLNYAKENGVENLSYPRLLRVCIQFVTLSVFLGIIYVILYYII
jgi:Na+/H+ antiporter NhaD/arsenite permease-like protein